jgi:hypothetical protein
MQPYFLWEVDVETQSGLAETCRCGIRCLGNEVVIDHRWCCEPT